MKAAQKTKENLKTVKDYLDKIEKDNLADNDAKIRKAHRKAR